MADDKRDKTIISNCVKGLLQEGKKEFIIFPYGKYGKLVEECLKENGITPKALVDNYISKTDDRVKGVEIFSSGELNEATVLIATVRQDVVDSICVDLQKTRMRYVVFEPLLSKVRNRKGIRRNNPHGEEMFLITQVLNDKSTKILDVGCGNQSANRVKGVVEKIYYIGLDVGNYNQTEESFSNMDEYIVVPPEQFAEKLEEMRESVDVVISSHNIEHCNEPERVLKAMIDALKKGGMMYFSFPSEASVTFPRRKGTLNFYDDVTHVWLPKYKDMLRVLRENGMRVKYKCKRYRPFHAWLLGKKNEKESIEKNWIMPGTWAYWGFETIIWAKKK